MWVFTHPTADDIIIVMESSRVPFGESFIKSQFSSIFATLSDFLILVILTEFFGIYYLLSAALGSFGGAVISFLLGRHWAFRRTQRTWYYQAIKYGLVSGLVLVLNVSGLYLLTDLLNINYIYSKIIVSVLIGFFVSFPLFRYFVYN